MPDLDTITVFLDFLAFVLFVGPAFVVARMAAKTSKFIQIKLDKDQVSKVFVVLKDEADKEEFNEVGKWKPWHNRVFYGGIFVTFLSYAIKLSCL